MRDKKKRIFEFLFRLLFYEPICNRIGITCNALDMIGDNKEGAATTTATDSICGMRFTKNNGPR